MSKTDEVHSKDISLENIHIKDGIYVKGACEHNLKNIDVYIPRNKMTVITGVSGSGKSTIAFDIIYAEGQRRYLESLSVYARNFINQFPKPDVQLISGLSPSIAIDQKTITTNPRSTVGTITEVYDYIRLLFARVGDSRCPVHGISVSQQSVQQIIVDLMSLPNGQKFYILAPMAQDQKGEFLAEFNKWFKKGFVKAKVDGEWIDLEDAEKLSRHKRHNIDLLIDRLIIDKKFKTRLSESLNTALSLASGMVKIEILGKSTAAFQSKNTRIYSVKRACPECGYSYPEMEPRLFSFNNPRGACNSCGGLGYFSNNEEYKDHEEDNSESARDNEESYQDREEVCTDCEGTGLKEIGRHTFIDNRNISEYSNLSIEDLSKVISKIKFSKREKVISEKIIQQIQLRLDYMIRVGTGYLSLNRRTKTLSGGEVQRIRLATQVGSSLVGVLYILDEPSIGLHPRDHHRLLEVIQEMKDRGNTVIVVEHDEDTIKSADHIIDLGPSAGILGGEVIGVGNLNDIKNNPKSLTGRYLSQKEIIDVPNQRRKGSGNKLVLKGACGNNLRDVNLTIPLGTLCGVTGVSGSGKSTLIVDTLYKAIASEILTANYLPADYKSLEGIEFIDKIIPINQKPIGRTPRSIPATYVGLLPLVRSFFSNLPEAKLRGFRPGHFSFNVKGGRCEFCQGRGVKRIEMHFLSDVFVTCEVCRGRRYNAETLSIRFKEKNIADILDMSIKEAYEFFIYHKLIAKKLKTLLQVGMDYMTLGQNSTTLSGGEAQRIKLSRELSKTNTEKTIYILDEPTTGLHFSDIKKLIALLQTLVDQGSTVIVIEHNMDMIKSCDHIVDLGPEGGPRGGCIVSAGTPEKIASSKKSITGQFLKNYL